jgi:sulfite exporter TauE/SafE
VTGNWVSVLTKLIPLGLVIALSPITVIPAVLVLHAPRPRPASLAFLTGWVLGLVALTAAFGGASDLLGGLQQAPPRWASWVRVVLGSALIAFGIYTWFTRQRHRKTPGWLRSFSKLSPARAGVTGAVLVAASTVAVPILGFLAAGDRLDDTLERVKVWMEENHAAMMAVILVVIGLIVLYNGIHAL